MGGIKGPRCNRYSRVARSCLHILHRIRLGRSAEAFCSVEVPTVSSPALKGDSSGELGNIAICKGDPSMVEDRQCELIDAKSISSERHEV
jgi:hypothetical protein